MRITAPIVGAAVFCRRLDINVTVGEGGLVMDSNGNKGSLVANLQGPGTVTKAGRGTLTVSCNQTGTGPLICQAGGMDIGCNSVARPITVKEVAFLLDAAPGAVTNGVTPLKIGSYVECRLYIVTPSSAQVLSKTHLYTFRTHINLFRRNFANYEGLCVARRLADGSLILLLIADSQNQYRGILRDWLKTVVVRCD